MAKNITKHVNDMTDDTIPKGTAVYIQVRDPKGAIGNHAQWVIDHAQWVTDGSVPDDEPKEPPFAAAVDDKNPTLGEQLFMQNRFMVTASDKPGQLISEPAAWAQINATNFPTMNIPALKAALKNGYDEQRVFEDLVPAV